MLYIFRQQARSQPCSSRHCRGLPRSVAMGRTCAGSPDAACIFNKNGKACQVQPGQTRLGACSFSFQVLLNMNSACNCRCSWRDATQLAKVTENPSGRARLRQLLRKMPPASRLVALGRIDEQLYGQCFEAEFGRLRGRFRRATDPERSAEGLTAREPIQKERRKGEGKASPLCPGQANNISLVYDNVCTRIRDGRTQTTFSVAKG